MGIMVNPSLIWRYDAKRTCDLAVSCQRRESFAERHSRMVVQVESNNRPDRFFLD
jgi:hypothetical protein